MKKENSLAFTTLVCSGNESCVSDRGEFSQDELDKDDDHQIAYYLYRILFTLNFDEKSLSHFDPREP